VRETKSKLFSLSTEKRRFRRKLKKLRKKGRKQNSISIDLVKNKNE
jgi:hypothetical protein